MISQFQKTTMISQRKFLETAVSIITPTLPSMVTSLFILFFLINEGNYVNSFQSKPAFTISQIISNGFAIREKRLVAIFQTVGSESVGDILESSRGSSKRTKFLNLVGFQRISDRKNKKATLLGGSSNDKSTVDKVEIKSIKELDDYFKDFNCQFRATGKEDGKSDDPIDYKALLTSLSVIGNTQLIGSKDNPDVIHPVLQLLHERKKQNSKPSEDCRPDGCKIALAIEGGGMRGCHSAGMVVAIDYLGLRECIDVVYGSSAGSLIGSYFLTKQLPWFGPELYYDSLTTAGNKFIDSKRLLRAIGFGLVDPRLLKDVITRPKIGKPVLNLDFLLKYTAMTKKPLNWEKFKELQKVQPLKVIASGLKSGRSFILSMENGDFDSLEEFTNCMHASMLLPGIAGPVMNVCKDSNGKRNFIRKNNYIPDDDTISCEPMVDAVVYEPIPYRSAIKEGATHVVVLRTRPDGVDITGKPSFFERLIFKRFFLKKNKLQHIFDYMTKQLHKKLYGEDVIVLNDAAIDVDRDCKDTSNPHLMTIALPPGSKEITRLETDREAIFEGVRRGFARAYDCLVEDPNERGRGAIVAKEVFPDEILKYDPLDINENTESAFSTYLKEKGKIKV